jgi:hypothetical protein
MKGFKLIGAAVLGTLAAGSAIAAKVGRLESTNVSNAYGESTFSTTIEFEQHSFSEGRSDAGNQDQVIIIDAGNQDGDYWRRPHRAVSKTDTWLMVLLGGGLIGYQLRRKQRAVDRSLNVG